MKVFLAGGHINGKYQQFKDWFEEMKIYLASVCSTGSMNVQLTQKNAESILSGNGLNFAKSGEIYKPYILESFFYSNEDTERLLPYFGDFLLDSGAFTFMSGNHKGNIDWDEYVKKYAEFIKRNQVEKFFELDIDSVVGYEEVKKLRKNLEWHVGRKCIPVWHVSRGYSEYKKMCAEYEYVAIGGIVSKEIKPEHYSIFPQMIKEAHKHGTKVHGLGFTNLQGLQKYHFDSVDSTAWTTGNRFGYIYKFNGRTMEKVKVPKGSRLGSPREAALVNFTEWIKFQKYAETHL